ncbi:MAG: acyl carrier protein, partial [Acidobacteriota bacterium]
QRYDDDVRTDSPVLPVDRWRQVLQETGFAEVAVLPEPGSPAEALNQHVFLAREAAGPEAAARVVVSIARGAATGVPEDVSDASDDLLRSLEEALPEQQHELLVGHVRTQVARVLRLGEAATIDRRHRLMDLGLDSLMAVELRGLLERGLRLTTLSVTLVFDYPTIEEIAAYLMRGHFNGRDLAPSGAERLPPTDTTGADAAARVADLSDDAVEALLIESLKQL